MAQSPYFSTWKAALTSLSKGAIQDIAYSSMGGSPLKPVNLMAIPNGYIYERSYNDERFFDILSGNLLVFDTITSTTGDITVAFRFKINPGVAGTFGRLYQKGLETSSGSFDVYSTASGTLTLGQSVSISLEVRSTVFTFVASTTITVGTVYSLAITRASNTWTLWKDGVSQGSTVLPTLSIVSDRSYFGNTDTSSRYLPCSITDILVATSAIYTANYTPVIGLYAAQISGTITETSAITDWTITGISPTGLTASTTTSTSSYTLNCPSLEPYTITCSPTVNGKWVASTAIALDYYVVATNPEVSPRLYKCTTAGTTSATEPTWPLTGTVSDGTVIWTFISDLINPISLGSKIPA